ncbi:sodium:proton antiporter [Clostridium sp. chh4-2]|uniref:Na+/H+ antiporter NhaC family protein n=1 Tax=Clostridium sp. chh4-2 TaxID=2067550 RepID=UPI000CCF8D8A|nr:Na+/H+ antiporter NhaC family protein [Clostridium sp. chh4-2]PNV61630.1 sodium:proton antiporter [Clostridium sp. chh4-2]
MENNNKKRKEMSLGAAVCIFLVICAAIAIQKVVIKGDMGSMFFMLWVFLIPVGIYFGHTSSEMERAAIEFTHKAVAAILVLLAAGALIGTWISSGTTPALIYYGLKFISPKIFLVASMLLCSVVSLFCGTSNGTVGTAGVALVGIGNSMGIPTGITAGAVICGAFFGDKMSPVSDTNILSTSITGVNMFKHIRYMVFDQVPGYIISLIFFFIVGLRYTGSITNESTIQLMQGLQDNFNMGFFAFLPMLVTGGLLAMKQSSLLAILGGAVMGIFVSIFYQGMNPMEAVNVFYSGFSLETSSEALSTLLNRGGVADMWGLAGITLFGFTVAGMLDYLEVLKKLAEAVSSRIRSITGLAFITILFGFVGNAISLSQNFAIVMTGTLMNPIYPKYNLLPKNCSRDLQAGGTYGAMFIPWNNNTIFVCGALGVTATSFIPYIPLLYLTPVIVLIYTVIRYKVDRIYDDVGFVDVSARLENDPDMQKAMLDR